MRRIDTVYKPYNQDSDCERQLRTLLATEPALRDALHLPAVDENTLDLVIEIAVGRLRELQAVVDAAQALEDKYDFWMEYVEHAAHPYVCTYCHTASDNPYRLDTHPHASDCLAKALIDALAKLPGYE